MSVTESYIKKYPLLPFSQLVYEMTRWTPNVYTLPLCLLWRDGAKDQDYIEHVLRVVFANHPVFQMQVDHCGMHYEAPINDILNGRYHSVRLSKRGDDLMLNVQFNRILGDGASILVLINDFAHVYNGGKLQPDDYWHYLETVEQQKKNLRYYESREWLKKEFADSSIPVRPTIDRIWLKSILPSKAGIYIDDYTESQIRFEQFKERHLMSYEAIFSLCAVLAIAEYCNTEAAAVTWAYSGRGSVEEQRIFGSLHRDVPFQIKSISYYRSHKSELIHAARNQIRSGIAHSDYPYTLSRPYNQRWNYAVNVLRNFDVEEVPSLLPNFPLEVLTSTSQKYAYALLDIEIVERPALLQMRYRYSATHYKESSIRKFAALVHKYAEWLLEN